MLLEALQYLTTPCARPYRRMGYLKELIATEARYKRNRASWQPHIEQTRLVIIDAANKAARRGSAVVLGGGMLADIPLDELARAFERVRLVDVCFSRATRNLAARYSNVERITCDITGVADDVIRGDMVTPDIIDAPWRRDADLIVSANVLTQLPLIPIDHLRRIRPEIDEAALEDFAAAIIRAHLALLETCAGTRCLVSEVERQAVDGDRLLESLDPLRGVLPDRDGREWIWDIAPRPEIASGHDVRNRVKGMVW